LCGGQCINPLTDSIYCGASGDCLAGNVGITCGNNQTCSGGVCTLGTCRTVGGINWCYHPTACGKACNDTCAFFGKTPMANQTTWLNAQNSVAKCQTIATAFGVVGTPSVNSYTHACLEDSSGTHQTGVLKGPLLCSSFSGCPESHLTNMDNIGVACNGNSRIAICPCE
jgi:hypothetical protein